MHRRTDTGSILPEPASSSSNPKTTLEDLPPEIILMILERLPNRAALWSLIRSSKVSNACFFSYRRTLLSAVILNEIGPDTLSDAFARFKFQQFYELQGRLRITEELWRDIYTDYHASREIFADTANLSEATLTALARFHRIVQDMSISFFKYATSLHPITRTARSNVKSASATEIRRITGAFYRFEICCLMLKRGRPSGFRQESELTEDCFFNGYNTWDLEEVACIRDYFHENYRIFIQGFEEFSTTAPGATYVKTVVHICVSEGLLEMKRLIDDERRDEFEEYSGYESAKDPKLKWLKRLSDRIRKKHSDVQNGMRVQTIFYELDRRGVRSGAFDLNGMRLTGPITNQYRKPLTFEKGDSEPNHAFLATWSQSRMSEAKFADQGASALRSWGYVMWDRWRLEEWGLSPDDYSFRRIAYDEWRMQPRNEFGVSL